MKLTKETRDLVKIGTLFRSNSESYMVTNMWDAGKGKCITVRIMEMADPKNQCWIGHNVYGRPLSEYYGLEMENYDKKTEIAGNGKKENRCNAPVWKNNISGSRNCSI